MQIALNRSGRIGARCFGLCSHVFQCFNPAACLTNMTADLHKGQKINTGRLLPWKIPRRYCISWLSIEVP